MQHRDLGNALTHVRVALPRGGAPCISLTIPQNLLDDRLGSLGHWEAAKVDEALKRSLNLK